MEEGFASLTSFGMAGMVNATSTATASAHRKEAAPVQGSFRRVVAAMTLLTCGLGCAETTLRTPTPVHPTRLEVGAESVDLDCVGARDRLACSVRSRTRIDNPGDGVDAVDVKVRAQRASEMRIAVDGALVDTRLLGGEVTLPVAVPPKGSRTVTMLAEATLSAKDPAASLAPSPLEARHPWLGEDPRTSRATLRLCPASVGRWGRARAAQVRVLGPRRWTLRARGAWHGSPDGRCTNPAVRSCTRLAWLPERRKIPVYHGGPVLGAGWTFSEGFRARVGYEAGIGSWLIASLDAESDLDQSVLVAPVLEAAMPAFVVIPSIGVGLGVPVRLKPDAAAGVRGQLTMMWGLGASLSVDYYPSEGVWQSSLMAVVGL